jgi:hypothetical protein
MVKTQQGMQTVEAWSRSRQSIKDGRVQFGFGSTSCPGCYSLEIKGVEGIFPWGWIWYRHETGNVLCILQCFVQAEVRRCGALTQMFDELLRTYPETRLVVTGRATEYSVSWLKKRGFKFNRDLDRWELWVAPIKKSK